ncbi:putative short-chain dehydrogenases/reductase [Xylogone sp. PMI_703]|nr:putative short-chain dehydrogenases/reductase [Xylogone sp. PMI_703]
MSKEQYLAGKLAIVTGASKGNGIGAATAYSLASHGANIVVHYFKNSDAAAQTVQKLEALGVKAAAIYADQQSPTFGKDIVEASLQAFNTNTIDIIVNNAAAAVAHENLESVPVEDFDWHFHINVRGPFLLMQASLPYLASPGGRIINISSVMARSGTSQGNFYSASKAALSAMSLGWAEQLGQKEITVNVISPGPIATDRIRPEDHPVTQKVRAQQYIKRNGTTSELAEVIGFLASPMASFVTGQNIYVDGGLIYP